MKEPDACNAKFNLQDESLHILNVPILVQE